MVEEHQSLEQLNARLDRVNRWVENCDQKVCIVLALVGACLAVFISSSSFEKARTLLIQPFYAFLTDKEGYCFSWRSALLFAGLFPICFFAIRMFYYLLKALSPKTNPQEYSIPGSSFVKDSLLHFQTIAKMGFDEYKSQVEKDTAQRYRLDILSQIYINSLRCDEKMTLLKKGIHMMSIILICISIEAAIAFFLP